MNWDAIGATGEVLGAVGVIVTLLYLSLQVKASTQASRVESKLASSRMYTDFLGSMIENPELGDIFRRGRADLESLEPEEFYRFSNMAFQSFSFFSAGYFQNSRGSLGDGDWYEFLAIVRFWLRGKGCQRWWENYGRVMFGPDFVAFIDAELKQSLSQPASVSSAPSHTSSEARTD